MENEKESKIPETNNCFEEFFLQKSKEYAEHFQEHGWVTIPNVMSSEEQKTTVNEFYEYLEELDSGIDKKNSKTWTGANLPPSIHGIDQLWGVAHKKFVWDVRTNSNVILPFAHFYGTDKLWCSFDRINFTPAPEGKPRQSPPSKTWWHTDQGFKDKEGLRCIQGLVTLGHTIDNEAGEITMHPTTDLDASLMVMDKSHQYHAKFGQDHAPNQTKDWYKLTPKETTEMTAKFDTIRIVAPAGSLLLWDSRTFHYASGHEKKPREVPAQRLVIYVCYQPCDHVTEAQIKKKKQAFENERSTSHWPLLTRLFQKPQTYGNPDKDMDNFTIVKDRDSVFKIDEMKKLSGVIPYDNGLLGWSSSTTPLLEIKYYEEKKKKKSNNKKKRPIFSDDNLILPPSPTYQPYCSSDEEFHPLKKPKKN